MKKITFLTVLLITFTSLSSLAADYRIGRVETLGTMKDKVIFQSRDLKAIEGSKKLVGQLVLRWGTHRFQIVDGFYTCSPENFCTIKDYKHVAMFEKCVVVKKNKVDCVKPVSGRYSSNDSSDIRVYEDVDSVSDEFGNNGDTWYESPEYPARDNGEFDGIVIF